MGLDSRPAARYILRMFIVRLSIYLLRNVHIPKRFRVAPYGWYAFKKVWEIFYDTEFLQRRTDLLTGRFYIFPLSRPFSRLGQFFLKSIHTHFKRLVWGYIAPLLTKNDSPACKSCYKDVSTNGRQQLKSLLLLLFYNVEACTAILFRCVFLACSNKILFWSDNYTREEEHLKQKYAYVWLCH